MLDAYSKRRDSKVSARLTSKSFYIYQIFINQAEKIRSTIEQGEPNLYSAFMVR